MCGLYNILPQWIISVSGKKYTIIYDCLKYRTFRISNSAWIIIKEVILNNKKLERYESLKKEIEKCLNYLIKNKILINKSSIPKIDTRKIWSVGTDKRLTYPESLTMEIIQSCNFKCLHCYVDNKNIKREIYLSREQILDIVKGLKNKTLRILITGGEPTLHPDLINILRDLVKSFKIRLNTNGSNISSELIDILKKCDSVQVSIYALNDCEMERFTTQKKIPVKTILSNVTKMKESGVNIILAYSKIGSESSEKEIHDFISFCKKKKFNYSLGVTLPIGNMEYFLKNCKTYYTLPSKVRSLASDIVKKFKCYSCVINHATIFSNGDVSPCVLAKDKNHIFGNINYQPFLKIWNGKKYLAYHESIFVDNHNICSKCEYKYVCGGPCAIVRKSILIQSVHQCPIYNSKPWQIIK